MIFKESLSVCQTTKKTEANEKLNKRRRKKKCSICSYSNSAIKIQKKYVNNDKQIKAAEYVEPNNPLFSDDWYDQKEKWLSLIKLWAPNSMVL